MRVPKTVVGLVDDEPSVRRGVDRLLTSAGYSVRTFASGEDLLDAWSTFEPACLILDVSLGGMSGLELREQLVARGVAVPIIFITAAESLLARGDEWRSELDRRIAGAELLLKPFDEHALFEKIHQAIARASVGSLRSQGI